MKKIIGIMFILSVLFFLYLTKDKTDKPAELAVNIESMKDDRDEELTDNIIENSTLNRNDAIKIKSNNGENKHYDSEDIKDTEDEKAIEINGVITYTQEDIALEGGGLNSNSINEMIINQPSFDASMDRLLQDSFASEKAMMNKENYQNLLLQPEEYLNGKIEFKRIECGEKICMAKVNFNDEELLDSYISNLQNWVTADTPINSFSFTILNNHANLLFSTGHEQGKFVIDTTKE